MTGDGAGNHRLQWQLFSASAERGEIARSPPPAPRLNPR